MASSSVSQDDVDNNFEKTSRRSRIRTARARQIGCRQECQGDAEDISCLEETTRHMTVTASGNGGGAGAGSSGDTNFIEHETSPKPILRTSAAGGGGGGGVGGKDVKRPNKPLHHVNKGKQQRDRRKLREKRRSTGVVHLASTESTGGSTTGDDEESSDAVNVCSDTKKNTLHNESLNVDMNNPGDNVSHSTFRIQNSSSDLSNGATGFTHHHSGLSHHHHHHHHHPSSSSSTACRDKSPSDLEADDENDHDSLNQSEGSCSHLNTSGSIRQSPSSAASASSQNDCVSDQVRKVVEENRRLLSLVEEKDRRIHMLESKVQKLMRDTLSISEEQSRLQRENSTLLRALSKLTRKPSTAANGGGDEPA